MGGIYDHNNATKRVSYIYFQVFKNNIVYQNTKFSGVSLSFVSGEHIYIGNNSLNIKNT